MNEKLRERVLWVLESVYRADPEVMQRLIDTQVFVKDPTEMPKDVVLRRDLRELDALPYLDMLSVLNAILGSEFRIEAVRGPKDELIGFRPYLHVLTRK